VNPGRLKGGNIFRTDIDFELENNVILNVMDQAFVTDYPLEVTATPNLSLIYKSGIIATKPIVCNSEPRFHTDGKTKIRLTLGHL